MRDETAEWLTPMLAEAHARGMNCRPLMAQATMPAAEVDWASLGKFDPARYAPPGASSLGIDWIRFGGLLRDALGWQDYPPWPESGSS